jgi:hypothetical protein
VEEPLVWLVMLVLGHAAGQGTPEAAWRQRRTPWCRDRS